MATQASPYAKQKETEAVTAHVLWMTTGLSCEGDSVAMTSATNPSLEDIILQAIPGMPKVVVHNQVVDYAVGQEYAQAWFDAGTASSIRSCWSSRDRWATRRSTARATGPASRSIRPTASRSR